MKKMSIQKLYYSIRDVSELVGVKQHVLRYWESEFSELKPSKNRAGNRIYRARDIKIIFLIKKLLYEEKFTVDGAKRKIRDLVQDESKLNDLSFADGNPEARSILQDIRNELSEIEKLFEEKDKDRGVAQSG